jgi:hypothetical protein
VGGGIAILAGTSISIISPAPADDPKRCRCLDTAVLAIGAAAGAVARLPVGYPARGRALDTCAFFLCRGYGIAGWPLNALVDSVESRRGISAMVAVAQHIR